MNNLLALDLFLQLCRGSSVVVQARHVEKHKLLYYQNRKFLTFPLKKLEFWRKSRGTEGSFLYKVIYVQFRTVDLNESEA